ncbi:hypothetical protein, variant [Phytophthora nicotianae CJ01A1]|uniref:Uncharacterized protein n=6 Tax=Phytophthora nicotianae TaxID=4792 RepID=V9DY89_PHYNI|nr:hypothetical protein PPTG_18815 [Phytophthora nicotianae INRA-310]XP_008915163.1 hypothetical protein, variant [Phytophthora nicotianae INRA-310]ETI30967.1 hypothetical protein F443_21982 [Phytophthora nicotianae P1569]ETK71363.1 hypothetical protein L915_21384 [Phytophthora nicotianae]ETO59680.1 hypothetical protein F444_22002 [Phytophthora nicotianae P1976]ETP00780.1 hypothetical protein F441_21872 [Phytophthora nicotianae CJ01A1]ETP28928.1 hypothetical protein F442_21845 [Phytophthora n
MNSRPMNVLVVAVTLLVACCALVFGTYTYPQCATDGKGCCEFGTGLMRNRGYVMIELEGDDMVVTCHKGVLRCSYENPNKKAHYDAAENVTCPDFTSMMESRSEITYLEGVQAQTTTADDESAAGTVKAADIST